MATPAPSAGKGIWANRNWRLLWSGQAISLVGDYIFYVTVLLWVATIIAKGRSWAPAAASGTLIAEALPILFIGPVAGVYVDRWNRRRTMMTADACRALIIVSMLALPTIAHHLGTVITIVLVYVAVALESTFSQFFNPSRLAILGTVVEPAQLTSASGLLQATSSLAFVIGPVLATPLLFAFGIRWALVINALSFLISFFSIRALRLSESAGDAARPTHSTLLADFRAGIGFFTRQRVLIGLLFGVSIAALGTGAVNALAVFFVTDNLHAASSWLGTLLAGFGAGAVVGAVLTSRLAVRVGLPRVFWLGLTLSGIGLLGFSLVADLAVAVPVIALVGMAYGTVQAAMPPLILAATPQRLVGRVMAVVNPVMQLAGLVSTAVAGILASTVLRGLHAKLLDIVFGPINTIFACGALLMIAGGLAAAMLVRDAGHAAPSTDP
jgi:MFS family permease